MKNKSYGFPYDYSNRKAIHSFTNETNGSNLLVYREGNGYAAVQKNQDGYQTRIKLDDISLNTFINKLDQHGWVEKYS